MDASARDGLGEPREVNAAPHVLVALMVLAAALVVAAVESRPAGAEVALLATGTGDCTVARVRCGRAILINGGGQGELNGQWGVLMPYLLEIGVQSLDALILTGPKADDVGGIPTVLVEVPVGAVFMPHKVATADYGRKIRVMCSALGVPVYDLIDGQRFDLGAHGHMDVSLWDGGEAAPAVGLRVTRMGGAVQLINLNDPSNLSAILAAPPGRADVLRLLEDGAASANPTELLAAINPDVAIISRAFKGRTKSDPTAITVMRTLESLGAEVYRTDIHGTVTVRLTPRGALVSSFLRP